MPSSPTANPRSGAKPRIFFWGTPEFAVPSLRALIDGGHAPVLVVTQPDKPVGRHATMTEPPVKQVAREYRLPVFQPKNLKSDEALETLQHSRADMYIVCAYGTILPQRFLSPPKFGAVNVHASLLPALRGASPIQQAILDGLTETGVTIMLMDECMDHGPILAQEATPLNGTETITQLQHALAQMGASLLMRTLARYLQGSIRPHPQEHAKATTTPLLTKESGKIDWTQPARHVERMIRAYSPWPGVWTAWNGKRLKLIAVRVVPNDNAKKGLPGTVLVQGNSLFIHTGSGMVSVDTLQPESRPVMPVGSFIRGYPGVAGARLP